MTELSTEQLAALAQMREPFPQAEIRYKPRVTCYACRDSKAGCQSHQVRVCDKCKQRITAGHIDLAFVGHAEATNRLLNVDPMWEWEPMATDDRGLPQFDGQRGLWIRLTVCGMTRLGYGHAGDKGGGDAVKEIIGDAIRNAGMRFGMALDLWTSSDLEVVEQGDPLPSAAPARQGNAGGFTADQRVMAQAYAETAARTTDKDVFASLYKQAVGAELMPCPVRVGDESGELGAFLKMRAGELVRDRQAENQDPPGSASDDADDPGDDVSRVSEADLYRALDSDQYDVVAGAEAELQRRAEAALRDKSEGTAAHAAAVASLRAWAVTHGVDDIDGDAYRALGAPVEEVSARAIRELLAQLQLSARP